ncbi:hypothetical protein [Ferruginibacter sp. SUN106]|uniref:hypothetical protein n=1 Tax=Ferruginibacter sp. SUN106 TaxID=2978348 RepID=UPI003D36D7E1
MNNAEFYIGWMPKAPSSFAKQIRRVLLFLLPLAVIVALLMASFQKKFSSANFEFGTLTEVKGIYINNPLPMLKVVAGKDIWGNASYITIPLVGYGKHGAATALMELEKEKNSAFNNKELTLKGTLLYSDGKTLLQINKDENPVVKIGGVAHSTLLTAQKDLGVQTINGEIIDPKCYFGVMKPGEGKVHRDCAIRCILGGIPPVLKVLNEKGEQNYYLIVGPNGEPMNETVQDYVAEPVAITAHVVQQDDWIILYVMDKKINRISGISLYKSPTEIASCIDGCMK